MIHFRSLEYTEHWFPLFSSEEIHWLFSISHIFLWHFSHKSYLSWNHIKMLILSPVFSDDSHFFSIFNKNMSRNCFVVIFFHPLANWLRVHLHPATATRLRCHRNITPTSGSRIWPGGDIIFFPRFYRRSEAESGKQSKPILAGVQGLP